MFKVVCCDHSGIQHDASNGFCRQCTCTGYEVRYYEDKPEAQWFHDEEFTTRLEEWVSDEVKTCYGTSELASDFAQMLAAFLNARSLFIQRKLNGHVCLSCASIGGRPTQEDCDRLQERLMERTREWLEEHG